MFVSIFDPDSVNYAVYLDGVRVPYVAVASEEKGVVIAYAVTQTRPGLPLAGIADEKGRRVLIEQSGKVEIRREENPQRIVFDPSVGPIRRVK